MMSGEQQPLDALHADLIKVVEHAAISEVDHERCIAIAQDMGIAGVSPDEKVRAYLLESGAGLSEKQAEGEDDVAHVIKTHSGRASLLRRHIFLRQGLLSFTETEFEFGDLVAVFAGLLAGIGLDLGDLGFEFGEAFVFTSSRGTALGW